MTKIEWVRGADGSEGISWNALRAIVLATGKSVNHCEHVNEACRFCYAEGQNRRFGGMDFKPGNRDKFRFEVDHDKLMLPLRRKKPTRIFVESMSDAFGEWWPTGFIDQLYAVMALSPQHTYINLSKRPERRRQYLADREMAGRVGAVAASWDNNCATSQAWTHDRVMEAIRARPLPNVIEGTSVSNQEEADEFVPILQDTNAAVRAVSAEPLLGGINFTRIPHKPGDFSAGYGSALEPSEIHGGTGQCVAMRPALDWIIVGGESGPKARPMMIEWARSIRDQCVANGVAFFFKQWGSHKPDDPTANRTAMTRVGKKAAGRILDGRTWDEFPVPREEKRSYLALANSPKMATDAAT